MTMEQEMREAVDFLYGIPKFTTKNSLEHTRLLMERLGDPGKSCKIIHVAGSNGKGSVCCFLYHMLLYGGKSAGMFTSPHLMDIRERFSVNGELCRTEDFLAAYRQVRETAEELVRENRNHPTFFEFIFAMGMLIYERAQVEYVVLETGLGGRLDATNSFPTPLLTVITSISLEHTEILGDTIREIAWEKAGIIKRGVPLVFDANDEEAAGVIRARAAELDSPCVAVTEKMYSVREINNNFIDFSLSTDYDKKTGWRISSPALYQVENAALAVTAMRVLQMVCPQAAVGDPAMREALLCAVWPGRMQEAALGLYLDGAHNAAGIRSFTESVRRMTARDPYPPLLLFSMVKDKDYMTSVRVLTSEVDWEETAVTAIPGERGIAFEELQKIFEEDTDRPVTGFADYRRALSAMRKKQKEGQKLFCTGSLYFVGALMELLKEDEDDRF